MLKKIASSVGAGILSGALAFFLAMVVSLAVTLAVVWLTHSTAWDVTLTYRRIAPAAAVATFLGVTIFLLMRGEPSPPPQH
jgi:heme/copper-type cytochrome/quinol oxidase subunit 4